MMVTMIAITPSEKASTRPTPGPTSLSSSPPAVTTRGLLRGERHVDGDLHVVRNHRSAERHAELAALDHTGGGEADIGLLGRAHAGAGADEMRLEHDRLGHPVHRQ